jgi:hypothetical protein
MSDLNAAAKRLQEVQSLEELVGVLMDPDVQTLLSHPQVGKGWQEWVVQRRQKLSAPPAPPAPAAPAAPTSPGILGKVSATAEKAAEPEELDIVALAERAAAAREDFYARMDRAYKDLIGSLAEERLGINRDAEYVDQVTDFAQWAGTWLQVRIAKGEMSVEEAVARAKKEGWTEELTVRPDIYRAMMAAFQAAGLFLLRRARVDGEEIDVQARLGQAIEAGQLTPEEAVELAEKAGWTRPFHPAEDLEERIGPDKARELREAASSRGRGKGRRK